MLQHDVLLLSFKSYMEQVFASVSVFWKHPTRCEQLRSVRQCSELLRVVIAEGNLPVAHNTDSSETNKQTQTNTERFSILSSRSDSVWQLQGTHILIHPTK